MNFIVLLIYKEIHDKIMKRISKEIGLKGNTGSEIGDTNILKQVRISSRDAKDCSKCDDKQFHNSCHGWLIGIV